MARGCLVLVAVAIAVTAGGLWWLIGTHFTPGPPIRVATAAADLEPWPDALEVVAARTILGNPQTSSETDSPRERLYVLLEPADGDLGAGLTVAVDHLVRGGWRLQPAVGAGSTAWFAYDGPGRFGERLYLGPLRDYLGDLGLGWASDDRSARTVLRGLAGDRVDELLLVQVFPT